MTTDILITGLSKVPLLTGGFQMKGLGISGRKKKDRERVRERKRERVRERGKERENERVRERTEE